MTRRVVIDTLRISGLAGPAPARAEVEAAVRRALAARPAHTVAGAPVHRVERPTGTTLAGAADAAAGAAFGERRR